MSAAGVGGVVTATEPPPSPGPEPPAEASTSATQGNGGGTSAVAAAAIPARAADAASASLARRRRPRRRRLLQQMRGAQRLQRHCPCRRVGRASLRLQARTLDLCLSLCIMLDRSRVLPQFHACYAGATQVRARVLTQDWHNNWWQGQDVLQGPVTNACSSSHAVRHSIFMQAVAS